MTRWAVVVVLMCVATSGCGRVMWDKPGATEQEFRVDSYACERDMRQSGYFGGGLYGALNAQAFYERCMESKGYQKTREASAGGVTGVSTPTPSVEAIEEKDWKGCVEMERQVGRQEWGDYCRQLEQRRRRSSP